MTNCPECKKKHRVLPKQCMAKVMRMMLDYTMQNISYGISRQEPSEDVKAANLRLEKMSEYIRKFSPEG